MDVDVWPVQLPLMPRKYLPTTFHIQGVSEVRIRRSILRVESQEESGRTLETVVSSLESSIPSATDTFRAAMQLLCSNVLETRAISRKIRRDSATIVDLSDNNDNDNFELVRSLFQRGFLFLLLLRKRNHALLHSENEISRLIRGRE